MVLSATSKWASPAGGSVDGRMNRATHFEVFDDFLDEAVNLTGVNEGNWIGFGGDDGDADVAVTVTSPEGTIAMGSGDAASAENGSVLSLILLAKGSLVSLGMTVFETRMSVSSIAGNRISLGLSDVLADAAETCLFKIIAGDITDGGSVVTNAICFQFDAEATTAGWHGCLETNGTIENTAASVTASLGVAPTVNTYQIFRIEVDADGAARFYIDGVLLASKVAAKVKVDSLLIPYLCVTSESDTEVLSIMTVDYILFQGARPAAQ
jgi:hypothetical protein